MPRALTKIFVNKCFSKNGSFGCNSCQCRGRCRHLRYRRSSGSRSGADAGLRQCWHRGRVHRRCRSGLLRQSCCRLHHIAADCRCYGGTYTIISHHRQCIYNNVIVMQK